ncbi:MAG: hypothetical protein ACYC26_17715 [Phycisphaerales bacterium]
MATRSSGVSGAIYGLVIFVFLFVIALAMAILFYAQRSKTQEQLTTSTKQLTEYISAQEEATEAYHAVKQEAAEKHNSVSVFGQMLADTQTLKRWIAGADKPIDQIKSERDTTAQAAGFKAEDGSSTLAMMTDLKGQVDAAREQITKLNKDLGDRSNMVKRLNDQFNAAQKGITQERDTLAAQLKDRTTQFDKATADYETARKQLLADLDKARADAKQQVVDLQATINTLQTEIDKKDGRIRELAGVIQKNRLSAPDLTLEPDGKILDVVAQDNLVYINLGRDDHLILGMTFEVFDENAGIRTQVEPNGQTTQVGGKASIEVVRFGESGKTAACRIVRNAYGRPVVPGDLISNIVYDRNRVFRFFVFGDFDLDHNGQSTAADRERVLSLIQQWGGQVISTDQMPVDTDFLVLGMEPAFPQAPPDDPPPTEDDVKRFLEAKKKYKQYSELSGQARELSIPILNQNRFLTLIGYYDR